MENTLNPNGMKVMLHPLIQSEEDLQHAKPLLTRENLQRKNLQDQTLTENLRSRGLTPPTKLPKNHTKDPVPEI